MAKRKYTDELIRVVLKWQEDAALGLTPAQLRYIRRRYGKSKSAQMQQECSTASPKSTGPKSVRPTPKPECLIDIEMELEQRFPYESARIPKKDQCKWPIGDPKEEHFYFCQKKKIAGKNYCKHHYDISIRHPLRKESNNGRHKMQQMQTLQAK